MKKVSNFLYWFLIVIAVIQFVPIDRENKPVDKKDNFVNIYKAPSNIENMLKRACYDCHSNETVYPDYAYVAPISWSVKNHVNEGREHLNLSEWGTYSKELKKGMLENSAADLKQDRMPIAGYIAQHPEARLGDAEKKILIDYLEKILKERNY